MKVQLCLSPNLNRKFRTSLFNYEKFPYTTKISRSSASKRYICLYSKSLTFFRTSKNGLNFDYFAKIAHKIAKSKYFSDI